MKIDDTMKRSVISIIEEAAISDAVRLFLRWRIGTLPVVDSQQRLTGLLLLSDVLKIVMPDVVELVDNFDFLHDFGVLETRHPLPEELSIPVIKVMKTPVAVEEGSGLLRAAAVLKHHNLRDLPVISQDGRLVGIVSYVDIGVALIQAWGVET